MTSDETTRRRAPNSDYVARHQSAAMVRPFLRQISAWQARCAYLRVQLGTHTVPAAERDTARVEMGRIRRELRSTLEQLRATDHGAHPDGRVRDVVLSLTRLDDQLCDTLGLRPEGQAEEPTAASSERVS